MKSNSWGITEKKIDRLKSEIKSENIENERIRKHVQKDADMYLDLYYEACDKCDICTSCQIWGWNQEQKEKMWILITLCLKSNFIFHLQIRKKLSN